MSQTWINGNFVDEETASLPLRDAGLLYAAGVFTTMRAFHGRVYRLGEHLARLRQSCQALFIPLQYKDDALQEAITELLKRNELTEARLRLTVTRGATHNDPVHGIHMQANVFCSATQAEPYPEAFYSRGMTVTLIDDQKLNPYDLQAGHKTLNYFSRLAALRNANKLGAGEALWFNVHNYLQSGSITNVFVIKDGTILTPPTPQDLQDKAIAETIPYPKSSVLPGITRAAVIELATGAGIPVKIAALTVNDLLEADEVFLTNSMMQVMPVGRVERKAMGSDKPGEMTLRLSALLAEDIEKQTRGT